MKSEKIEVSYFAAGIVAHLASDSFESWNLSAVPKEEITAELTVTMLFMRHVNNINLRTFITFLQHATIAILAQRNLINVVKLIFRILCLTGKLQRAKWLLIDRLRRSFRLWQKIRNILCNFGQYGPFTMFALKIVSLS